LIRLRCRCAHLGSLTASLTAFAAAAGISVAPKILAISLNANDQAVLADRLAASLNPADDALAQVVTHCAANNLGNPQPGWLQNVWSAARNANIAHAVCDIGNRFSPCLGLAVFTLTGASTVWAASLAAAALVSSTSTAAAPRSSTSWHI
jgi:hypothetical protein